MVDININVEGFDQAVNKLKTMPDKLDGVMKKSMDASLMVLWENVPPYPARPETSAYVRTGTLGRTIGSSPAGGKGATPTVYSVTGTGMNIQGTFGTNLSYAKHVIDPDRQAYMHKGRWWTMRTIRDKAINKINKLWLEFVRVVLK